jgi:hypothetical protein
VGDPKDRSVTADGIMPAWQVISFAVVIDRGHRFVYQHRETRTDRRALALLPSCLESDEIREFKSSCRRWHRDVADIVDQR